MADALGGYRLSEPRLRFDFENRRALSTDAYYGLRELGPFDIAERRRDGQKTVNAVIVGRDDRRDALRAAAAALQRRRMNRLHEVFEVKIVEEVLVPAPGGVRDEAQAYRTALTDWLHRRRGAAGVGLAFVLHDGEELYNSKADGMSPYYASKAALLRAGVPTQSICYENLAPSRLEKFYAYFLSNILTACYAKIGGTPWVVQQEDGGRPQVTLGVAMTVIPAVPAGSVERFVGISAIFAENGAFVLWQLTPLHEDLEAYETSLEKSIVETIRRYEDMEGKEVARIACHVSGKRAGRRESDAIRRALARFEGRAIAADLVHISDTATLWLFDGHVDSHRPRPGYVANLSAAGHMALLHTEGGERAALRKFPTRPLKLGVYSDLPEEGCAGIFQHLYDLRWMSWRGVGTAARPVSIDYPARMAKLLAHLYVREEFDAIDVLPELTTKAWFL